MDMGGLWFIAGNVVRDVAALNNMEMLPWDVWGAMAQPGEELTRRAARLFRPPGGANTRCRRVVRGTAAALRDRPRPQVPGTVFNALLQRPEAVF